MEKGWEPQSIGVTVMLPTVGCGRAATRVPLAARKTRSPDVNWATWLP